MKCIHKESQDKRTIKVYRDSAHDEYRVRLYIDGKLHVAADYHTGEKADAIETASAMVRSDPKRASIITRPHPLSPEFNCAVLHITAKTLPLGFEVAADAPQTFEDLVSHFNETGQILVWNGASGKTVFDDSEVNYAFRAWHDSKHILGNHPFTEVGEMACLEMQKADVRAIYDGKTAAYFCHLLDAEIAGQFHYSKRHGGFPLDQYAFAAAYVSQGAEAAIGDKPLFGISMDGVDA